MHASTSNGGGFVCVNVTRRVAAADGAAACRMQARQERPRPLTTGELDIPRRKLSVEVVWADITRAKGDVHCVGHYMGVLPQKAERALDEAMSGYATGSHKKLPDYRLDERGALHGALGEVLFFPWDRAGSSVWPGWGALAPFTGPSSKSWRAASPAAWGFCPHRKTIATVLIGSGPGNLTVPDAVEGLIEGVAEALIEDTSLEIGKLRIVECYLDRALEILDVLSKVGRDSRLNRDFELDIKPELAEEDGGDISAEFGCSLLLASLADSDDGVRRAGHLGV